jgi:hypothetical protein
MTRKTVATLTMLVGLGFGHAASAMATMAEVLSDEVAATTTSASVHASHTSMTHSNQASSPTGPTETRSGR